jgi:hypothetical protein
LFWDFLLVSKFLEIRVIKLLKKVLLEEFLTLTTQKAIIKIEHWGKKTPTK